MKRIAAGLCGLMCGVGGWLAPAMAAQPLLANTGMEAASDAALGSVRGAGERFDLTFPSAPLQAVLDYIAAHAPGRPNIVIRAQSRAEVLELQQMKITANKMQNVTWETALDYLAGRYNFVINKDRAGDGVVYFDKVPRVTETFIGTRFGEAVSAIARRGNANIVFSPKVQADTPVTLSFTNVPWRDALESLLKAHECTALAEGGGRILRIATMAEADVQYETVTRQLRFVQPGGPHFRAGIVQADKAEFVARNGGGGADAVSKSLLAALELVKSPSIEGRPNTGGRVTFESRTNTLIICDTAVKIQEMLRLVDEIDRPPDQVHIKARILTQRQSPEKKTGVNWGSEGIVGAMTNGFSLSGFTKNIASGVPDSLQLGTLDFRGLKAVLQWVETRNDVDISQAPEILVLDNEEASVFIGSVNRYIMPKTNTDPNSGAVTLETEEKEMLVGVQLFVIPHICAGSDQVILEVLPREEEEPTIREETFGSGNSQSTIRYPETNYAKYVHTKMMLKSGETGIIAGLISDKKTESGNAIPVMSRIPLVKHAFKNNNTKLERGNTIILVTPTIISSSHDTDFQNQVDKLRTEISAFQERPALMPASSFPQSGARVGRISGTGAGPLACR